MVDPPRLLDHQAEVAKKIKAQVKSVELSTILLD
jgi:hypothetical protein